MSLLLFNFAGSAMKNTVYSFRQRHILAETRSFVSKVWKLPGAPSQTAFIIFLWYFAHMFSIQCLHYKCAEITLVYFVVLMQIKNEKPGFGKHTEFFLTSTDSKRNIKKKIVDAAAGIFKENSFFFIRVFIHEHWAPLTNMETAGRQVQRAHLCTQPVAELKPTSFLSEVNFLTTEPSARKENTVKFQRKVNPAWVINSITINFFLFSEFGGQFYEELFQHYFSCYSNHK